jgi:hypothetical protein
MMKFFQDKQPPNVWDPARNKVTVRFENKVFETDDPALAELLVKAGYRYNGSIPEPETIAEPEPEVVEEKPVVKKSAKPRMVRKKK